MAQHDLGDSKTEKNEDSVSNVVSKQAEIVNSATKNGEEEKSTIKIEEIMSNKNNNNQVFKKRFAKDLDYVESDLKVGIFEQSNASNAAQYSVRPDPLDKIIKQGSERSKDVSRDKDATHDTNTSRMKAHDINPYLPSKYSEEKKNEGI